MRPARLLLAPTCSILALNAIANAQAAGPDVIVAELAGTGYFGQADAVHAYSIATDACNIGDTPLDWYANTPAHPLIAQHLYRIHDGRIEQIGLSSVVHTAFALQSNTCGFCVPFPSGLELGAGCSSPNSASSNANQLNLGPRHEINASTGDFPFPFTGAGQAAASATDARLQVPSELILPGASATYFIEAQFIAADDAQAGNNTNNASHRRVSVNPNFTLALEGPTIREQPAIFTWGAQEPGVVTRTIDIENDGRFHVAARAVELGGGAWRYHYAIHNLSSHRSASGITIPVQVPEVSDPDFHAPLYHSGSPVSNAPWLFTPGDASVRWSSEAHTPMSQDSANAVRFGTTYTFSFTAPAPPTPQDVTIDLFRPGSPGAFVVSLPAPSAPCVADFAEPFGALDFSDVASFLVAFSAMSPQADLAEPLGLFDFSDVTAFLAAFGAGCP